MDSFIENIETTINHIKKQEEKVGKVVEKYMIDAMKKRNREYVGNLLGSGLSFHSFRLIHHRLDGLRLINNSNTNYEDHIFLEFLGMSGSYCITDLTKDDQIMFLKYFRSRIELFL